MVTCWERADFLALLYVMYSCVFITFPYGILGQVWYLIVSILDLCLLLYFVVSFKQEYSHKLLVNGFSQANPGKSVVRFTDCLEMTVTVDWPVEPETKHDKGSVCLNIKGKHRSR